MKYLISILFILLSIVNAQTAFTMNNMKVYYKDTIDDLSGSISYCSDGYYVNDVKGVMMGQPFHQYQMGTWSYDTAKDQLTQTMLIAKDIDQGTIIEDYRANPALSTTISNNVQHTFVTGVVNNTTRIVKIELQPTLDCQ